MSTSKKIFLRVLPIVLVLMVVVTSNVFAFGNFNTTDMNNLGDGAGSVGTADKAVGKLWNTISLILQVCAVAAIVFAGVRYMFASADGKADIKKQTVGLVVGALLVFAAVPLVNFVVNVAKDVTSTN